MIKVAITRCDSYDEQEVNQAVKRGIDLIGGIEKFVKPGDSVLLKVNLLMPKSPEVGITTHPAVMKALANIIKEVGQR